MRSATDILHSAGRPTYSATVKTLLCLGLFALIATLISVVVSWVTGYEALRPIELVAFFGASAALAAGMTMARAQLREHERA